MKNRPKIEKNGLAEPENANFGFIREVPVWRWFLRIKG
jgi:hypothetical protein